MNISERDPVKDKIIKKTLFKRQGRSHCEVDLDLTGGADSRREDIKRSLITLYKKFKRRCNNKM